MRDERRKRHPDSARPLSSSNRRSEFDLIEQVRRRAFRRKENESDGDVLAVVDEVFVGFVGDHNQVTLPRETRDRFGFGVREHNARRILRRVVINRAGA